MKKLFFAIFLLFFTPLMASEGSFEDSLADVMTWVVLIVMPIGGIYLFWLAHIYPEKVAEENNHPQLKAIKTMCILSLFVGGLLWPFALIWANYNYGNTNDSEKVAANKGATTIPEVVAPAEKQIPITDENQKA